MSGEELQMILEALKAAGEGAGEAFVYYLLAVEVLPTVSGFLLWTGFFSALLFGVAKVGEIIRYRHDNPKRRLAYQPVSLFEDLIVTPETRSEMEKLIRCHLLSDEGVDVERGILPRRYRELDIEKVRRAFSLISDQA